MSTMLPSRWRKSLYESVFLSALGLLFLAPVQAETIYAYTGNPFDTFTGSAACPPTCRLTGSLTLAAPVSGMGGFSGVPVAPLAWSFTDGSMTLTQVNSKILVANLFDASTNGWTVRLSGSNGASFLGTEFYGSAFEATDSSVSPDGSVAYIQGNRGTWTVTTSPEPETLALLACGLLLGCGCFGLWNRTSSSRAIKDTGVFPRGGSRV